VKTLNEIIPGKQNYDRASTQAFEAVYLRSLRLRNVAMLHWMIAGRHFDTQRAGLIFKVRNGFIE